MAPAPLTRGARIFKIAGAADHVGFFEFDDTHGWSKPRREATYRWFTRWLQDKSDDGIEDPDVKAEPAKNLLATPTGQVATSFPGAETVQSLNAALAEELYAKRAGAGGRNIAAILRARLGIGSTPRRRASRGRPAAISSAPGIGSTRSSCNPNRVSRFRSSRSCRTAARRASRRSFTSTLPENGRRGRRRRARKAGGGREHRAGD